MKAQIQTFLKPLSSFHKHLPFAFSPQFNPSMPLQPESPYFCKEPSLKDKIHTVVFVIDASKVKLLSEKTIEKLVTFRRKTNQIGNEQCYIQTSQPQHHPLPDTE